MRLPICGKMKRLIAFVVQCGRLLAGKILHMINHQFSNQKKDEADSYYKDYEPVFLLDHVSFGSKYRFFSACSLEFLVNEQKPAEDSETAKLALIHAFKEEIHSYEDLGCILLAIQAKYKENTPILRTLMHYRSKQAIISKLAAEYNCNKFKKAFYLNSLICGEYIPTQYHGHVEAIVDSIANIVVDGFKKNSEAERYDAFKRIKHGPLLVSSGSVYAGKKYGDHSNRSPGVLIKATQLSRRKSWILGTEIEDTPFIPYSFVNSRAQLESSVFSVDVCTRIQQLLIICYLQRFHKRFIASKGLNQKMLFNMGMNLYKLMEQLPTASVRK